MAEPLDHRRAATTLAVMAQQIRSAVAEPEARGMLNEMAALVGAVTVGLLFASQYPAEAADTLAALAEGIGEDMNGARPVVELGKYAYDHAGRKEEAP